MTKIDNRPCFIYAITHIKSGRRYVGSALKPNLRWSEHKCDLKYQRHHCAYLQKAWSKYGPNAFEFSILRRLETNDPIGRAQAELAAISECKCYNSRISNLGLTNFVNSPETRKRMKQGMLKRRTEDEQYRDWLRLRGEQLAAHAKTPERRAARAELTKELWTDPKHRKRVAKKLAIHWNKEGMREEHSIRVKLHRSTLEARKLNSEAIKAAWANPKSKMRSRKFTRWDDPKAKQIQAVKMRAYHAARREQKRKDQLQLGDLLAPVLLVE